MQIDTRIENTNNALHHVCTRASGCFEQYVKEGNNNERSLAKSQESNAQDRSNLHQLNTSVDEDLHLATDRNRWRRTIR